jgi:hypothetical protein
VKTRRVVLAAVLLAGSGLSATAQAGPAQLPVAQGGRSSANVHLLANIPTGTGTGGAFLGSTYFQTSADTVWFSGVSTQAVTGGLLAFDVSKPEAPRPIGSLPIPHHENEDLTVSAARKLVVISQQPYRVNPVDTTSAYVGGREYVVDVSVPSAMRLVGVVTLPASPGKRADGRTLGGPGHTTTLVDHDRYLWIRGARDGRVHVVDLRDATAPSYLGSFSTPAGNATKLWNPGVVHDADVDQFGDVTLTGSGGTALYTQSRDPL